MSIIIKSGTTSDLLTVDTNKQALVNLPTTEADAGFVALTAESDSGSVTGTRTVRALEVNEDYSLRVGVDNMIFNETFNSTTINPGQWYQYTDTMTIAQASGFLTLNNNATTTDAKYAGVKSYRTFSMIGTQSLYIQWRAAITNPTATNKTIEMGWGYAATTSVPTDGAVFRWKTDGTLVGVVIHNSSETASSAFTAPTTAENHSYCIVIGWGSAEFWIDDVLQARVSAPVANSQITRSSAAPFYARVYNGVSASAASKINISNVMVAMNGAPNIRPYPVTMASFGRNANTGPTSFTTLTTQCNWTNTPTINSATLANNAAPSGGYTGTTLGGLAAFPAVNGATTDYIVFTYTNEQGTKDIDGRTLFITDIRIDTVNSVTAVATTATVLQWALAFGGTAVDLSTADGVAARAARKVPLGQQSWIVGAGVGVAANPIYMSFNTPFMVESGTILHIVNRCPIGTATATEVFLSTVAINGFWE